MRVAWVHPSCRDLVIEHLSSEPAARERFLRNCSVNGALLALSLGGGRRGRRELPLVRRDADWDARADRLHTVVPELEPAELFGLVDALALTIDDVGDTSTVPELNALATAIAITWAELLPTAPPSLSDSGSLERFADWLTLAEMLMTYDSRLLADLGFPGHTERFCEEFLDALDLVPGRAMPADSHLAVRAIGQIISLIPRLAVRADTIRFLLSGNAYLSMSPSRPKPEPDPLPRRRGISTYAASSPTCSPLCPGGRCARIEWLWPSLGNARCR